MIEAGRSMFRGFRVLSTRLMDRFDAAIGLPKDDRRENGGATVEFVIVLPVFIMIFLASFEASMLLLRQVMLERGVDLAVREVRLDNTSSIGAASVRQMICEKALILPNCEEHMMIELQVVEPDTWTRPAVDYPCADLNQTIVPNTDFDSARANKVVLMRACFAVRPVLPGAILGARLVDDIDGAYRMVAATVFVVEPPKGSAIPASPPPAGS